jgi:uncharacterized protein YheU (UPF0270 family)
MEIPHDSLHPATLRSLVEEFVTREGTDYGQEFSLQTKVDQVLRQLREHSAVIVYDASSGTCSIRPAEGVARP